MRCQAFAMTYLKRNIVFCFVFINGDAIKHILFDLFESSDFLKSYPKGSGSVLATSSDALVTSCY